MEHFVIFDDDDAGDGSDNMLEGDKRGKKGAAIWCHCSRPEVRRGIGSICGHYQHFLLRQRQKKRLKHSLNFPLVIQMMTFSEEKKARSLFCFSLNEEQHKIPKKEYLDTWKRFF